VELRAVALFDRFAKGSLAGLAGFWVVASVCVRGSGVPDWLLPAALAVGWLSWPTRAQERPDEVSPPRWLPWGVALVLGVVVAAVVYGAVATPSRHWDGAASFDAKAHWLTVAPTLQQPFFADPAVFHHSPDYPLLQPLLVAAVERLSVPGGGRLVFPGLFVLLLAIVHVALREARVRPLLRWCTVLAVGTTPMLVGPGGGAVDSGYCDLLLLVATTAMAAGLLQRSGPQLAVAILVAIASKPEGLPYAAVAWLAAFVQGERRLLLAAAVGTAGGLGLWLPLQRALLHLPAEGGAGNVALAVAAVAVATVGALAVDALARRSRRPMAVRVAVALGLPLTALACLPLFASELGSGPTAFGVYLTNAGRLWQNLPNLLPYGWGLVEYGVLRWHFGATFLLPIAALVALRCRGSGCAGPVAVFTGLGLLTTALPFLLSPEPDLQHHLRSSLPRLLLHWLGPCWLLAAAWSDALLSPSAPERGCATAPPPRS
jgi:hypothetical protein